MIPTFSNEEMLATKFRALLQRDKGRDLYDLSHGLEVFADLDALGLRGTVMSLMEGQCVEDLADFLCNFLPGSGNPQLR